MKRRLEKGIDKGTEIAIIIGMMINRRVGNNRCIHIWMKNYSK